MTAPRQGQWYALFVALLLAVAVLLMAPAAPSQAIPGQAAPAKAPPGEGNESLLAQLEAASRGYIEAKAALDASKKRQGELLGQLTSTQGREGTLAAEVAGLAATAYRNGGGLQDAAALLGSDSPTSLMDRMTTLTVIGSHNAKRLRELTEVRSDLANAKAGIDTEIANQEKQLAVMASKKEAAEAALRTVGGGQATYGDGGTSRTRAAPAPRRANGTFAAQGCTLRDPTNTGGCVKPRTAHAYQQAKNAGFVKSGTYCWRPGSTSGTSDHPRGGACDFSCSGGFGTVATGANRTFCNNMAAYFIANADRLGVLYVIWARRIWLPSSGWRTYSGGGTVSARHDDHNHLSIT